MWSVFNVYDDFFPFSLEFSIDFFLFFVLFVSSSPHTNFGCSIRLRKCERKWKTNVILYSHWGKILSYSYSSSFISNFHVAFTDVVVLLLLG